MNINVPNETESAEGRDKVEEIIEVEDELFELLDDIRNASGLPTELANAVVQAIELAEKMSDEMARLREVERDFRSGQEYATGWLEGCLKAFDALPGTSQLRRWVGEVDSMKQEVGKLALVVRDAAKAEAILRRAGMEPASMPVAGPDRDTESSPGGGS